MRREPLKYLSIGLFALLGLIEIFLLLSGYRVLLHEEYVPELKGALGVFLPPDHDAYYQCTYFTGRKQVVEELPAVSFDECPFIWTQR